MKETGVIATIIILFTLLSAILVGVVLIHRISYEKQVSPNMGQFLSAINKKGPKIKSVNYSTGIFGSQFISLQEGGGLLVSNLPLLNDSGYFVTYFDSSFQAQEIFALNDSETELLGSEKTYDSVKNLLSSKKRGIETFVKNLNYSGEVIKTAVSNK